MTRPGSTVPFAFVDVFASVPLTGNPVSIVPDADDLTEAQMQAIAREFNQSETVFVLRPDRPEATWRLRSFTPIGAEVFGAGHNALGTWLWLAVSGRLPGRGGQFAQQIGRTSSRYGSTPKRASRCSSRWASRHRSSGQPSRIGASWPPP